MILKGQSQGTRRKTRHEGHLFHQNPTWNGLGLIPSLRAERPALLHGHFAFRTLWQIKLSLCSINNRDIKAYKRGEAQIDALTVLLLEKQLAAQTERKVGWNHGQSGRIGEKIYPLILPGFELRFLGHKTVRQPSCHKSCRMLKL